MNKRMDYIIIMVIITAPQRSAYAAATHTRAGRWRARLEAATLGAYSRGGINSTGGGSAPATTLGASARFLFERISQDTETITTKK